MTKQRFSFYVNKETQPRSVGQDDAATTVLDYLRSTGLTGTKEGCATGDCGACTAVTVELRDGRLHYESLNTCIALMPMLAGRLLITVDGLAEEDGSLHPVQQAMVAEHGSQCGFCTPGFVMSLFTHVKQGGLPAREAVVERLSGNLCRCTGYLPIIRAGLSLDAAASKDYYHREAKAIRQRLAALAGSTSPAVLPRNARQLAQNLEGNKQARPVAGGTDLSLEITQQLVQPEVVSIGQIDELAYVQATKTHWEIGATATWQQCEHALSAYLPGFARLMGRFGSPQIRARATVGGNIGNASPIADGPPVFLALGCTLVLRKGAKRRRIALEDFYTGYRKTVLRPGEFIEKLIVARPSSKARFGVYKVSKRIEDDISAVCGAFCIELDARRKVKKARIAYGGMAATPLRAARAEKALTGSSWDETAVEQACAALARDYTPMSDVRASARYRMLVAQNLLRRFHQEDAAGIETLEEVAA